MADLTNLRNPSTAQEHGIIASAWGHLVAKLRDEEGYAPIQQTTDVQQVTFSDVSLHVHIGFLPNGQVAFHVYDPSGPEDETVGCYSLDGVCRAAQQIALPNPIAQIEAEQEKMRKAFTKAVNKAADAFAAMREAYDEMNDEVRAEVDAKYGRTNLDSMDEVQLQLLSLIW